MNNDYFAMIVQKRHRLGYDGDARRAKSQNLNAGSVASTCMLVNGELRLHSYVESGLESHLQQHPSSYRTLCSLKHALPTHGIPTV